MELESYFNFLAPDDIRVQGTRVGIESILWDYLKKGLTAEQIAANYRTVTLEQVYATLTYYWHNQEQVDAYLRDIEEWAAEQRRLQALNPSPLALRVRALREQRAREQQLATTQTES
jgi:uncharacterized protein (DUF433 family)